MNERSHRVRVPSMTNVEAYFRIESANEITTYHFDVRKGIAKEILSIGLLIRNEN